MTGDEMIAEAKRKIQEDKEMAENEKKKIMKEARKKSEELKKQRENQENMQQKLKKMQEKLLMGGVNLHDRTSQQEKVRGDLKMRYRAGQMGAYKLSVNVCL